MIKRLFFYTVFASMFSFGVNAHNHTQTVSVEMKHVETGASLGQVSISSGDFEGLVFTPNLDGLTPGLHGFHIHQNPSCEASMEGEKKVAAGAAGSHLDTDDVEEHGAPWSVDGHSGDLPALFVASSGSAVHPLYAPLLTMADVLNHSIMIHAGGDNYSDKPEANGGGGSRFACGVISK